MVRAGDVVGPIAVALEALARYRLRTTLSVVGVVIGVAAVIAMLSVGEGGARQAVADVEALGLDNLVVRPTGGLDAGGLVRPGLTVADADRLGGATPGIVAVSPLVLREGVVAVDGRATRTTVVGVISAYAAMRLATLARGRFLAPPDEDQRARVCVLGATVAATLFAGSDPIGAHVRILDDYYRVVGVLAGAGAPTRSPGALAWRDIHAAILVPLPTLTGQPLDLAPTQQVHEVWLRLREGAQAVSTARIVERTLERTHGAGAVTVVVPRELLAQRQRTQRTFAVVLGCVAALTLLVGGIGVMNNMLTAVADRTPEIGLRRVAGATRRDVLLQFLTEAVVMTTGGGVVGVGVGAGAAMVITRQVGWPTHVSAPAVLMGLAVALVVGILFGLYPAFRAAALQPVDAVRYE